MLAAIASNASNSDFFFSFCKTAYFWMLVAQKPAGKSHSSPGKKFAEKKEVWHSSTTFICGLSFTL